VLEQAFQAPVFNRYGSGETSVVAWECSAHQGLHIDADHGIVEILDEQGQPTTGLGEVVVTNLDAYAMPIIRYSLGDVARISWEPCPCGLAFPRLFELQGRVNDFVTLREGTSISTLVVTIALDLTPGVGGDQLTQRRPGFLEILLQRGPRFIESSDRVIEDELRKRTRGPLDFTLEYVEELPAMASGKRPILALPSDSGQG
jgi:phenylacetate-CoA ligase